MNFTSELFCESYLIKEEICILSWTFRSFLYNEESNEKRSNYPYEIHEPWSYNLQRNGSPIYFYNFYVCFLFKVREQRKVPSESSVCEFCRGSENTFLRSRTYDGTSIRVCDIPCRCKSQYFVLFTGLWVPWILHLVSTSSRRHNIMTEEPPL